MRIIILDARINVFQELSLKAYRRQKSLQVPNFV